MNDSALCLLVLAVVIALFIWNRPTVEIVALGSALLMYAVGLISADQVSAGFGDPAVVYVAALFAVGAALRAKRPHHNWGRRSSRSARTEGVLERDAESLDLTDLIIRTRSLHPLGT